MTNEEKAMLIAEENKCRYPEDMAYEAYSDEECYTSALEMAELKDRQLKEYLEKKRTDFPDVMGGTDAYAFGMKDGYVKAFDKIINELFPND